MRDCMPKEKLLHDEISTTYRKRISSHFLWIHFLVVVSVHLMWPVHRAKNRAMMGASARIHTDDSMRKTNRETKKKSKRWREEEKKKRYTKNSLYNCYYYWMRIYVCLYDGTAEMNINNKSNNNTESTVHVRFVTGKTSKLCARTRWIMLIWANAMYKSSNTNNKNNNNKNMQHTIHKVTL